MSVKAKNHDPKFLNSKITGAATVLINMPVKLNKMLGFRPYMSPMAPQKQLLTRPVKNCENAMIIVHVTILRCVTFCTFKGKIFDLQSIVEFECFGDQLTVNSQTRIGQKYTIRSVVSIISLEIYIIPFD
uniref:Uncharacterized protein n=1 Tax=Romanomermis culicivorax TaxID=13658 RepID=A0A915J7J1_ROMCU